MEICSCFSHLLIIIPRSYNEIYLEAKLLYTTLQFTCTNHVHDKSELSGVGGFASSNPFLYAISNTRYKQWYWNSLLLLFPQILVLSAFDMNPPWTIIRVWTFLVLFPALRDLCQLVSQSFVYICVLGFEIIWSTFRPILVLSGRVFKPQEQYG